MKRTWGLRLLVWLGLLSKCCAAPMTSWDSKKNICDDCGKVCE